MRDAIGGSIVIVIIVVFIVIVSGYLAFNVNYTKAFRMKNKIISYYDDYNGQCDTSAACRKKIREYADDIGYRTANLKCPAGSTAKENLYCSEHVDVSGSTRDTAAREYYKITTKINVEIPVINYFFNLNVFNVSGNTKTYIKR